MATKLSTNRARSKPGGFRPPYPPSWPDRLGDWLDRLPGPALLYYLLIGLAVFTAETLVQWQAGTYPVGTFVALTLALAILPSLILGFMHYVDKVADRSLASYRPALRAPQRTYRELGYRLTTMPARSVAWASIAGIAFNVLLILVPALAVPFRSLQIAMTPVSLGLNAIVLLAVWTVGGTFTYHTLRQLSLVSRIYTQYTQIDLLNLGPLYALSRITATTAMGIILSYLSILSIPAAQPLKLLLGALLATIALGTLVTPLLGAHRLLIEEKGRRLGETSARLRGLIQDLHRGVDSGNLRGLDRLNNAISGLEVERNLLEKVPTWPWEPQTVQGLIAALLLPVAVWLVQLALGRILGP